MKTSKAKVKRPVQARPLYGLAANGCAGPWQVDIEHTTSGPEKWHAQIDGPAVSISFAIGSAEVVGKMIQFLEGRVGAPGLELSKDRRVSVSLARDDECSDRYFLVIGQQKGPTVRLTLAGEDLSQFQSALKQVEEDLADA